MKTISWPTDVNQYNIARPERILLLGFNTIL